MGERDEGNQVKAGTNEQEAAMSLLRMIARAEQWWDPDEKLPSRSDILSAYSDCVAAARGEYGTPEPTVEPEPISAIPVVEEKPAGPTPLAVGGLALYAAVRDLAAIDKGAVNENQAEPELLVVDGHVSVVA
ncbi:MAG TPA: hypothetical protein VL574_12145 [Stellaceae bacterium]|nr:hypothetical protein [Stellaceae bacterium]